MDIRFLGHACFELLVEEVADRYAEERATSHAGAASTDWCGLPCAGSRGRPIFGAVSPEFNWTAMPRSTIACCS